MRCSRHTLALLAVVAGVRAAQAQAPRRPETSVRASVAPYTVSEGFQEVVNYADFKKVVPLTPEQETLLRQNLFACSPRGDKQLYWIYGKNDYRNLPSFVTTDAVLQLYHVFFDSTLRATEEQNFLPILKKLTAGMLAESIAAWKRVQDPALRRAALKNVAYFGVVDRALGASTPLPPAALTMVRRELALIRQPTGYVAGAIFPYKQDYTQFIVRGHYTRSEILKRYFTAMMWYGLAPFALTYQQDRKIVRADEQIRQALLLTRALYRTDLSREWDRLYEPTALYVGAANDLTPAEWKQASDGVFGADASESAFANTAKLDAFVEAARKLRAPKVQSAKRENDLPDPTLQFRFMGQRYTPDGEIMQRLTGQRRIFPTGLDVMAVLGSARAQALLDASPDLYNPKAWTDYLPERRKLQAEFAQLPRSTWHTNLYWSWIYALKALLAPAPEGYPSFMQNTAWQEKSLHTALASWTELRHDTILYGQQTAAEQGDGEEPPFVPGYIEPNVVFFDRLLFLTRQSRDGLKQRSLLSKAIEKRFGAFEDLLTFLRSAAIRELRNEKLTRKEHERIRHVEGELESLTEFMLRAGGNYKALSDDDLDMALIADVHTGGNRALLEGVGHSNDILVIVPVEGRLYLARGGVFSYYEFTLPTTERLTDHEWKKRLDEGHVPAPPAWTQTFLTHTAAKEKDE